MREASPPEALPATTWTCERTVYHLGAFFRGCAVTRLCAISRCISPTLSTRSMLLCGTDSSDNTPLRHCHQQPPCLPGSMRHPAHHRCLRLPLRRLASRVRHSTSPIIIEWADQPTNVELWHIDNDRSTAAFDPWSTHNGYDTAARIHGRCSRTASSGSCASPRIRWPPWRVTPRVRPCRACAGEVCQDADIGSAGALRSRWSTARSW